MLPRTVVDGESSASAKHLPYSIRPVLALRFSFHRFALLASGLHFPYSKIQNPKLEIKNKPTGKLIPRQLIQDDLVVATHNRPGSFGTALGYDNAFLRFLLFN